jgi:hypothetical protein
VEVDLLEGFAVAEVRPHVAHEEDHRRGILERRVHAHRGLRGAGPARHEADAGAAGELRVRLGHVGRAGLVAADDELEGFAVLVEPVEHGEEALAGHAEREVRAVHATVRKDAFIAQLPHR